MFRALNDCLQKKIVTCSVNHWFIFGQIKSDHVNQLHSGYIIFIVWIASIKSTGILRY